ncbi:DNA polymerase III subunit epsilon [Alteromonas sediminis]|uniref:DNA-directed DNA polymerase n=1 Tax=Alteromonas sediminis TaxID=2259342 RepID=A0A3N5XZI5_9ALTE|nr:exonuclease domain-containing protein [Alteromonas sediminis]RPJ66717.1 DNA polymerase III subunit epsilon [Alteromonas sediminis]
MQKTLPPFYYLDHFKEFLSFFDGDNAGLLPSHVTEFIRSFHALNQYQQAIVVRVANRKYPLVATRTLQHEEILHPSHCIAELVELGVLGLPEEAPIAAITQALTKTELLLLMSQNSAVCVPASATKSAVIQACQENLTTSNLSFKGIDYIYRRFDPAIKFLLFVYFGHLRGKLNQFSMRDLGVMRTRSDAVTGEARFADAEDAQAAFYYACQREEIAAKTLSELPDLATLPNVTSKEAARQKAKFLYEAGKYALVIDRHWALHAMALSECDEAKEKWLRETYKDGHKACVQTKLEAIIEGGGSEKLLLFAEDFYARKYKQKRTSTLTDMLRNATHSIGIDSRYNQQVEQGVIGYYQRKGIKAWRTENELWRSLFGLTFWPLLFEGDKGALSNEFDRRPALLRHNEFYQQCGDQIDQLLATLSQKDALFAHILKQATAHYGKVNSLFMWRSNLLDKLKVLLEHANIQSLLDFLTTFTKDFSNLSDGYPDIMVLDGEQLRFEEIKAPGDKLRANQLLALQVLKRHGFDIHITQVEWIRDPNQPYVVVDIETTGGRAGNHRITEVGMVKMVAGKIVDEWQSLINPQRHIPSAITRLTGIDNNMVANAPLFCDVAEQIDTFTDGCIFVAHNVNFDLGFIKEEFARLEQSYRRPKLCTVQMMRKTYPGLKSYSLAALTAHFDIGMTRHHRAMSDAVAASQLLLLALNKENEQNTPAHV